MNTRSVKSSQVSALGIGAGEPGGTPAAPPSATRHGPIAPTWSQPDAMPGPPLNAKVTGRVCLSAPSSW